MAICLFSYLGVETAAVAAGKVRNPERNVPKSTIYGTLASAVGLHALADRRLRDPARHRARLRTATRRRTPRPPTRSPAAPGSATSSPLAVVISGIGALNGWTMICAEMPLAAAKDGLFPRGSGRCPPQGVPAFGIISSTALASVAVVISYLGANGATVFTTLVLMTGITAAIPYAPPRSPSSSGACCDRQQGHTPHFALDMGVAVVALVMSLAFVWYSRNSGDNWYVVWGPFLMAGGAALLGIPVYLSQRASMTEPDPRSRVQVRRGPATMTFHVDSEVGQLRQAIVHRPGLELARLTPGNVDELLFDDVMWAAPGPSRSTTRSSRQLQAARRRGAPLRGSARRGARRAGSPGVPPGPPDHRDAVRAGAGQAARRPRRLHSGGRCWPTC